MITQYNCELNVLVKTRPIDQYFHNNQTFIEGRKGSNYALEYRNNTSRRQKVVFSVDGLNVISGDNNWEKAM